MARRLPDARLAVIPNAGHTAQLEEPQAVNAHLRGFLHEVYPEDRDGRPLSVS